MIKTKKIPPFVYNIILLTVGSLLYALGIGAFLSPANLAAGGVSGIAIIINSLFPSISTGVWILIFNVPIMILGIWKFGFKFFVSTIYALLLSSLCISFIERFPAITSDTLLACAAGSGLVGVGIGLVFRGGATTGGSDIVVKLLHLGFPHIKTGILFLFFDAAVVAVSGIVFKAVDIALYAGIAVLLQSVVFNFVLYGSDEARIVYVISKRDVFIADKFLNELDMGVTFLNGCGAYSGADKQVLMSVMKNRMLPKAREIVRLEDPEAFMIVTNATNVFGEGFKAHNEENL